MKKRQSLLAELKAQRAQILAPREQHKDTEDETKQPRLVKRRPAEQKAAYTFKAIPAKN